MRKEVLKIETLPDLLMQKSLLNLTELAELTGITRQTFDNWRAGKSNRISNDSKKKLAKAIRDNSWGFRINRYLGSQVEIIIEHGPEVISDSTATHNDELQQAQARINYLIDENKRKDEIIKELKEKYEAKK